MEEEWLRAWLMSRDWNPCSAPTLELCVKCGSPRPAVGKMKGAQLLDVAAGPASCTGDVVALTCDVHGSTATGANGCECGADMGHCDVACCC